MFVCILVVVAYFGFEVRLFIVLSFGGLWVFDLRGLV